MLTIAHRVNTVEGLRAVPRELGVEMDVHGYGDRLVVQHDALADGIDLETWLAAYDHAFAIVNIKEEGIETRVRNAFVARGIERFFMLDLSFPALVAMMAAGERRVAVRVSDYEPVEGALRLAGQVDWVWLDVFRGFPASRADLVALRSAGFKTCLVSPELHGRPVAEIEHMREWMEDRGLTVDAVCTKRPDLW